MGTLQIAVIPGDGIGAEVVTEGLKVLAAATAVDPAVQLVTNDYDLGAKRYHATGRFCRTACWLKSPNTTRFCWARSATRACRPESWSGSSFCRGCDSRWTIM